MNAAILFEPDGYLLDGPKLMGRQSAGNGFLRAAVLCRDDQPVLGVTPSRRSGEIFRRTVQAMDPAARSIWIPADRVDVLSQVGVLYRPDQVLGGVARYRLRAGPAAYSLCGVTHTVAGAHSLEAMADILTAPLAPWDALICTSAAAKGVLDAVLAREADYLAWRLGAPQSPARPLFPIIPLGVHCADFAFTPDDRLEARSELDLAPDQVAVLLAGRISIAGKAHPYATFSSLQAAQAETGRRLVAMVAGRAFDQATERLFKSGLTDFCPDVRVVFVDGADSIAYRRAWAGADIFMSLADSIQETFGLTPLEAMASGLPALVTDWNGYRDTVRDGVDGF